VHGGYDLLKENLHVKPGQFDLNNALNEVGDPQQQFYLRTSVDLPHGVEFETGMRWIDECRDNNNGVVATLPSYWEAEARLGWRINKHWELELVGQNLVHDHHPEFGIPGPMRGEIARSVYAKLDFRW